MVVGDRRTALRKVMASGITIGIIVTLLGLSLLILAAYFGATLADFTLELGVAIGLSGVLWKCSTRIRQEKLEGKTDWSALLILGTLGVFAVAFAVWQNKEPKEVLLTSGAAFVTVWLFVLLEEKFLFEEQIGLPIWLKIIGLPFAPFIWLAFRGLREVNVTSGEITDLEVEAFLEDKQLHAALESWDRDSDYRDPEYYRASFQTTAADVSRQWHVALPQELVELIDSQAGRSISIRDGATITLWRWPAIMDPPLQISARVLIFGEGQQNSPPYIPDRYVVGINLEPGPLYGSIVRGQLLAGVGPKWPVIQPLEIIGSNFILWKQWTLGSSDEDLS